MDTPTQARDSSHSFSSSGSSANGFMEGSPQSNSNPQPSNVQTSSSLASRDTATTALKDIAFGSFAGVIGKVIEYPFDTVKVRLQAQPDVGGLRYAGPLDCFRQALKSDGFRGLYRGLSVPLLGAAAETSSLFFSVSGTEYVRGNANAM